MKMVIVCSHLLQTPEIPCIEILNDPMNDRDSGKNYLCPPCEARADKLTPDECHAICESHCDAMTVTETIDARTAAHTKATKDTKEV